jgi:hypothetical protein
VLAFLGVWYSTRFEATFWTELRSMALAPRLIEPLPNAAEGRFSCCSERATILLSSSRLIMSALNRDSIALMKECLCNLYSFKKPDDEITAGLKLALHERIAQLEMQELFSFRGDALPAPRAASFRPPPRVGGPSMKSRSLPCRGM